MLFARKSALFFFVFLVLSALVCSPCEGQVALLLKVSVLRLVVLPASTSSPSPPLCSTEVLLMARVAPSTSRSVACPAVVWSRRKPLPASASVEPLMEAVLPGSSAMPCHWPLPTTLLVLYASDFYEIASHIPKLAEAVEVEAKRRAEENLERAGHGSR